MKNISYGKKKFSLSIVNFSLLILSMLMLKFGYNPFSDFYNFIFSQFNPLIVTFSLAGYAFVYSLKVKVFDRMYWVDVSFCYVIYIIVYYLFFKQTV